MSQIEMYLVDTWIGIWGIDEGCEAVALLS